VDVMQNFLAIKLRPKTQITITFPWNVS